ncbi:MAG TPA: hypothetical protein VLT79_00035 [Gemmatimonadales bacterium]|nr:hypothetical protein [Gemmatimonadales bacterium]
MPLVRVSLVPALLLSCTTALRAQASDSSRIGALERFRTASESTATTQTWSATGAWVGGLAGAVTFGAAFYKFTHRDGAVNTTAGNAGGTMVGAAFGAAGGALLGAFIGSLFPKQSRHN